MLVVHIYLNIMTALLFVDWSELGHLRSSEVHDGLHVGLVEARDDTVVQPAVLRRLELQLVDVTILVPDGARRELVALRETLHDWDHLWPQLLKSAPVGEIEQSARALPKVAALVKGLIVQAQLLKCENFNAKLENGLDCQIPELCVLKAFSCHFKCHVNQMKSGHAADVQSKDFILLLLLTGLTSIDQLSNIFDRLSGSNSKGSLNVIKCLELGNRRSGALGGDQLFR